MFLEIKTHMQQNLIGIENHLSAAKRKKLQASAKAFSYEIIFCNINEKDFAPLFSTSGSRPNAPVNALVSSIILYYKKSWTTEELFDRIDFDLRTRTALGLHDLEETPFCPATFFNFQNRLHNHFLRTGENLIEQIFDNLTEAQLKKLRIKADIQRMDSFQAMSNISEYSRIQLLVEVLILLYRILSENDKNIVKALIISDTANPQNQFNLITDVAVEPNNTDDSTILNKRIDQIKTKCSELSELHTDGAYGSSENDINMNNHSINHIQTAVRVCTAEVPMNLEIIENNQYLVSCPLQSVKSKRTRTQFKACFNHETCNHETCNHETCNHETCNIVNMQEIVRQLSRTIIGFSITLVIWHRCKTNTINSILNICLLQLLLRYLQDYVIF